MRKCIFKYIALICLLALPVGVFAQADIHFSQFYETSILRNPALTGVFEGNYKIMGYYRNQWNSITNPYETMLIDLEYHLSLNNSANDFISFGLLGYSDRAGDIDEKITSVYPAVNFNKCVNKDNNAYLSLGFTGGYLQYSFDPAKATFNNQFQGGVFSPSNPTMENLPNAKMTVYDLGTGLNFNMSPGDQNNATYLVGISAYHLTQPSFSYYDSRGFTENMRWNVNAGMVHDLGLTSLLQVHFNLTQQGTYQEIMIGALLGWKKFEAFSKPSPFEIYAGLFYRYDDAVIPVIKMRYKDFGIGVSYDVNVSPLKTGSQIQGGPEITLSLTGQYPKNRVYANTVCPRFN